MLQQPLQVRGRQYDWGVVEMDNPAHCDFHMICDMLVRSHQQVK